MNGKKIENRKTKKRIAVLHGAMKNSGDFLIYRSGKVLLETYLEDFDFCYLPRYKKIIDKNFDGIIILGGPIITRTLHPHSKNIKEFLDNKNLPVFCLGVGISGKKFPTYNSFFINSASIEFWRDIYKTSKLFSVRDIETYRVLKNYGIDVELTGCPALCIYRKSKTQNRHINKILISVPNIRFFSIKDFLLTIYLLAIIRKKLNNKKLGIVFQHGSRTFPLYLIRQIARLMNIKVYDTAGKSIDEIDEIKDYDLHLGTRLHLHIYFLSMEKPTILLNVDMRTNAFLKTIPTISRKFSFSGVRDVVNFIKKNEKNMIIHFGKAFEKIDELRKIMEKFLNKIKYFYYNEKDSNK